LPLSEYTRVIRRWGWIVLLTAAIGAISALLFSMVQRPVYQSTIKLNVIGARPDFGLSQTLKNLLRNYAGQVRSYDTAVLALRDMEEPLDLTPEGLLAKINVQAVESDLQLIIEAEDHDPHVAEMIANQMAETFVWSIKLFNEGLDVRDRVNVFTSGPASPAYKVRPQKKLNTVAGGIMGGIAGLGIILLLEWVESRLVRRPSDVQRDLDLPVLGMIQAAALPSGGWPDRVVSPGGSWAIPLIGGIALGALLTTAIYLLF